MNPQPPTHHVVLDTDIGTDVDDAMALVQILGTPGLQLQAILTVYGDTQLRAQIARRYVGLCGSDIPVYAGAQQTLSGREVWWPGHEGSLHEDLEREAIEPEPAVDRLITLLRQHPGQLDIVAIGPLTNIATAIQTEPQAARWIRHLWIMGGSFDPNMEPEHNFRSDAQAAAIVLGAHIPTTITGLEVTRQIKLAKRHVDLIRAAGPAGAALGADITQWWDFWQEPWSVPHDPVTVLTLARPELFTFTGHGHVTVQTTGEATGAVRFTPDRRGWVRRATTVAADAAADAIVTAIHAADATSASAPPSPAAR